MMKKTAVFYFSPTGGTKKTALQFAQAFGSVREIDLCEKDAQQIDLSGVDLAVVAMPVFAGRVPAAAVQSMRRYAGKGTKAVSLAVYGNRAYEDALIELNDILEELDYQVVAAGAFVAQHSIVQSVGAGRPDEADMQQLRSFAEAVEKKLSHDQNACESLTVPGNRPYKEPLSMPAAPLPTDACTGCGLCAGACPVGAIAAGDPGETDVNKCIMCMKCTVVCPEGARALPSPVLAKLEKMLEPCTLRRENEIFL